MKKLYNLIDVEGGAPVKAWVKDVPVEKQAIEQLSNIAKMPFIHSHVAAMPDVHVGIGATVGSVIPTVGAVIPAAVGVDIGCGMMAAKTTLTASDLPENLKEIRLNIEKAIPHGRTSNGRRGDRGAFHDIPKAQANTWRELERGFQKIKEMQPKFASKNVNHVNHLGTLGTGNHFVEVCLDEKQNVWLMLHSGSRGVGNRIGTYFIELAKKDMKEWYKNLPDENLAYFSEGTEFFDQYVFAVEWAQIFAKKNRELMMQALINAVSRSKGIREFSCEEVVVDCHHNYISREHHFEKDVILTRKGAVSARKGELGIIPGSMGAKSFIVRGLGNEESFHSCSHGAGRVMSRSKAKKTISLEEHRLATTGVECRKDEDVLDETPAAYKSIDKVMQAQADLVEILYTLKQVVCVKG